MGDFDYGVKTHHPLHLLRFVHQFQNEKYLLDTTLPNVVRSVHDLETRLNGVRKSPEDYLRYNISIREQTLLRDIESISADLFDAVVHAARSSHKQAQ